METKDAMRGAGWSIDRFGSKVFNPTFENGGEYEMVY